jgi:ubiquinol-cytochrome c reductase cytochrome c subunit
VNDDLDAELGFEPAADTPPRTGGVRRAARIARGTRGRRRGRRSKLSRRLNALAVLLVGLLTMGGAYALFAGTSGASSTANSAADIAAGKKLYETSCITCHGANLQGVKDRGVPLLGVGGAAVYFQVNTGRMPATGQGPQQPRKPSVFTDEQTRQLAAYIQSIGGGTDIPRGQLRDVSKVAMGAEEYRLNCASCHGFTGKGAPLSAGKYAPDLMSATDLDIYTAMLSGPENMPIFSDNQLTPDQKRAIVAYVQTLKASQDPGGEGIGRIGPVSEGIVIWAAGIGLLLIVILWIGAKTE